MIKWHIYCRMIYNGCRFLLLWNHIDLNDIKNLCARRFQHIQKPPGKNAHRIFNAKDPGNRFNCLISSGLGGLFQLKCSCIFFCHLLSSIHIKRQDVLFFQYHTQVHFQTLAIISIIEICFDSVGNNYNFMFAKYDFAPLHGMKLSLSDVQN